MYVANVQGRHRASCGFEDTQSHNFVKLSCTADVSLVNVAIHTVRKTRMFIPMRQARVFDPQSRV